MSRRDETDVWARTIVGWHLAFALMMALALLAVLLSDELTGGRRGVAVVLLGLLSLTYWLGPAQSATRAGRRGQDLYLALAVAITGVLCAFDPSLSLVLFIVYAQVWLLSCTLARGIAWAGVLTAAATTGFVVHYGGEASTGEVLRDVGPQMAVSLLFSILLGLWISRIIDQSRERADLIAELEAARSELAAAHHAQGVMAERERLAREIHDTLAQGFTSVVMLAQAASAEAGRDPTRCASQLAAIEDVARENLAEARALVAAFTPVGLDGTTLRDAVQRLAQRFSAETGLPVDLQLPDAVGGLSRAQEVVLLRAAQEALTNVRRHAGARRVTVALASDGSVARVEVGDDGVGFDATGARGYGLEGMRGRVADVGGQLEVISAPGRGTRVVAAVPTGAG